ncbi:MAG: hypothetical protein KDE68_05795 [Rhodocyclaceae bacterium]|nr:hypothetical protein [Rhodocyclaceae bacterium]
MSRRALLGLVLILTSVGAQAQAPLGRLFFTPQERADLDRGKTAATSDDTAPPPTLDGIVRRSDGRATVWINGQPERRQLDSASQAAVQDADGRWITRKVGEAPDADPRPLIRIERGAQ